MVSAVMTLVPSLKKQVLQGNTQPGVRAGGRKEETWKRIFLALDLKHNPLLHVKGVRRGLGRCVAGSLLASYSREDVTRGDGEWNIHHLRGPSCAPAGGKMLPEVLPPRTAEQKS